MNKQALSHVFEHLMNQLEQQSPGEPLAWIHQKISSWSRLLTKVGKVKHGAFQTALLLVLDIYKQFLGTIAYRLENVKQIVQTELC